MRRIYPLFFALLFVSACGGSDSMSGEPKASAAFNQMESNLLDDGGYELFYHLHVEGIIDSDLRGSVTVADDNQVSITSMGQFGLDDVSVVLQTVGDSLSLDTRGNRFVEPLPKDLGRAVTLGLTRMGLLHNLSQLMAGGLPERASGGLEDWIQPVDFKMVDDTGAVTFGLVVEGQRTTEVTLTIDSETGLPMRREQVVAFPGGEMRVTETYSEIVLSPDAGKPERLEMPDSLLSRDDF